MELEKKSFFTEEFYTNVCTTLNVFNKLKTKEEHVAEFDMYESGEFLYFSVIENEETKKILSGIISDLEAYKTYNNEGFSKGEENEIALCALQYDHDKLFGSYYEIMWDRNTEEFVFRGTFEENNY